MLVEAAWSVIQQPGPLHAFYQRMRARRGNKMRSSRSRASSRRCSGRCSARGEDYAHQQPSLTAKKLRRPEIPAGAPTRKGKQTGVWATRERMRHAERALAQQAEASYTRMVSDWQATRRNQRSREAGASVTPGRA